MPTKHDRRTRRDLGLILCVVTAGAALITTVGSSASPSDNKVASSAFPKPAAVEETVEIPPAPKAATVPAEAPATSASEPAAAAAPAPEPSAARRAPAAPKTESPEPAPAPAIEGPKHAPDLPGYAVPASIDATGTKDVTNELLAFIASVPDGSVIRFPSNATYRVEGTLAIDNRNDLVFEGNGSTIVADSKADRNRRHWMFRGGSNLTIRDMNVRGANPHAGTGDAAWAEAYEAQHGFDIGGVENMLLERVRVTDVFGDFVYLGRGASRWASNIVIQDSHFERNGRQGIAITGAENVLITRNYIGETRRATFDIEPNGPTWGAHNIHITENTIGPGRLLFLAAVGNPLGPVSDVRIESNQLVGRAMNLKVQGAVDGARTRSGFRIANNHSDRRWGNSGGALMNFVGVDGVEVVGNVQPLQANRGNAGVGTTASCDVAVHSNEFPNAVEELRNSGGC